MNLSIFNLGNSKDLQLENGSTKLQNLHPWWFDMELKRHAPLTFQVQKENILLFIAQDVQHLVQQVYRWSQNQTLLLQNPCVDKLGCFVQERMYINIGTKI
jgi:hypothetical protein